jgi:thiamine biosynthesis lipoprotein
MSDASARKYVTVGFLFLVAGIVFLALSACEVPKSVFKDGLDVLGTSAEIVVVGLTDQQATNAIRAVEKDLERFDHIGYTLESTGELHRLNEAISRNQAMTVSVELKGLIEEAVRLSSASNGLFNPAAGELTALWEYECDKADCTEAPYPEEIKKLVVEKASEVISEQPSMDDLRFDGNEVTSRKTVVKLDLTDIMRGFALDRGMEHLKEMGVENAMIFLGSGVRTLGRKGKKPWWLGVPLVGLQDHMIGTIESRGDEALVTVHAFDKSMGREGSVYRHVIDPRSGLPVKDTRSVTVIHRSATVAGAAAVALLINGREGWSDIADKMDVGSIMMITQDGTVYTSPKMEERIHWKQNLVHQHLVP